MDPQITALLEQMNAKLDVLLNGQERWLTVREAAGVLDVAEETIREWCRDRRINARRLPNGQGWRVSSREVLRVQREGLLPPGAGQSEVI